MPELMQVVVSHYEKGVANDRKHTESEIVFSAIPDAYYLAENVKYVDSEGNEVERPPKGSLVDIEWTSDEAAKRFVQKITVRSKRK